VSFASVRVSLTVSTAQRTDVGDEALCSRWLGEGLSLTAAEYSPSFA
jgi:hypothetical protein